jgi:hypothetical protein
MAGVVMKYNFKEAEVNSLYAYCQRVVSLGDICDLDLIGALADVQDLILSASANDSKFLKFIHLPNEVKDFRHFKFPNLDILAVVDRAQAYIFSTAMPRGTRKVKRVSSVSDETVSVPPCALAISDAM